MKRRSRRELENVDNVHAAAVGGENVEDSATDPSKLRTRLAAERIGDLTALEFAAANGIKFLELLGFLSRHRQDVSAYRKLLEYQLRLSHVRTIARAMREAASGLRYLALLRFPFNRRERSGLVANPFQAERARWRDRISSRDAFWLVAPIFSADQVGAEWDSPYRIPSDLLEAFRGYSQFTDCNYRRNPLTEKIDRLKEQTGFDWSRRESPTPDDLSRLAQLFDDFAEQTEWIANQLSRLRTTSRGPKPRLAERAFRLEFAMFAKQRCGKYLDPLGAALFSVTFHSVRPDAYHTLRVRDLRAARGRGTKQRRRR